MLRLTNWSIPRVLPDLTGTFALHTNPDYPQSSFDDTLKGATWEQLRQLCSTVSPCVSTCSRCVYWHRYISPGVGGMLVTQGRAVPVICQMLYLSLASTYCSSERERESKRTEVCQMWAWAEVWAFSLYFMPCKAALRKPVLFMRGRFTASGAANVGRGWVCVCVGVRLLVFFPSFLFVNGQCISS